MINVSVLLLQIFLICGVNVISLRMGEKALNSWLCLVAVGMNLFVTKQITLFGLHVTATDSFAVGYFLGLNILQEVYGRSAAKSHMKIALIVCLFFAGLSFTHLLYVPNKFDLMQPHFVYILTPMPRLLLASLMSFFVVQLIDINFFQWLRNKIGSGWLTSRLGISLIFSQIIDTFLFSMIGLYGLIENIFHVMIMSLIVKTITIVFSLLFFPFLILINKNPKTCLGNFLKTNNTLDSS